MSDIYEHKRTKRLYRLLHDSFSVERQRHSVVFMSLKTGDIFDRDREKFHTTFRYVRHTQCDIEPRKSHE